MRFALTIEYDGTRFSGWQRQPGERTVQGCVEAALSSIANHVVEITCAGRTDTGVHAIGQVVHFDTEAERPLRAWLRGTNAQLPDDVSVRRVRPVADDFHARFSALGRAYRYQILNRSTRSALLRERTWWVHQPLDEARMQVAAAHLVGEHDFSSFRAASCQAGHAIRNMARVDVSRHGEMVEIDVEANAFLHHMVRNIVGTLGAVGRGEREPDWIAELLAKRDRTVGGVTAPARGLCFMRVDYPEQFGLAADVSADTLGRGRGL